jgi:general secretion pathway protein N
MARLSFFQSTARTRSTLPSAPWAWAVGGLLLGCLLMLLWQAPARWLVSGVHSITQGRVVLQDARGTVWQGSARLQLNGGAGSLDAAALPGRLSWQLRRDGAALQAHILADCCMQQALQVQGSLGWGGLQLAVSDSQSQWPAALLIGLGAPWNTVLPEGQLSLSTQGLAVQLQQGRSSVRGSVRLEALALSSRLSTLKPMGSYRFTLTGGALPSCALETLDGSLRLSGTGQWVAGRLRFDGEASATPERQEALSNLLNIIGRRDGARAIIKVG